MTIASLVTRSFFGGIQGLVTHGLEISSSPQPTPEVRRGSGGYDVRAYGSRGASPDYSEYELRRLEEKQARLEAQRAKMAAEAVAAQTRKKIVRSEKLEAKLSIMAARLSLVNEEIVSARAKIEQEVRIELLRQEQLEIEDQEEDLLLMTMMSSPFIH